MDKEYLEAFNRITMNTEYDNESSYDGLHFGNDCKLVDEALERLEQIDNSNPSEALACLEELGTHRIEYREGFELGYTKTMPFKSTKEFQIIKYTLLKTQENEKVLDILFKKQVDLGWLWYCIHECVNSLNEYNKKMPIEKFKLIQEEFELLKELS